MNTKSPSECPSQRTGLSPDEENQIRKLQPPVVELFEKMQSYPFGEDAEFAKGLSIILGHPDVPVTETEILRKDDLVLQAKCFYFSRKEKLTEPLDFKDYKAWLRTISSPTESTSFYGSTGILPRQFDRLATDSSSLPENTMQTTTTTMQEPAYPSSFAHIVELITTGQPIPGIQQIPDTVLTGHETPSTKPKRRKPWEKDDSTNSQG